MSSHLAYQFFPSGISASHDSAIVSCCLWVLLWYIVLAFILSTGTRSACFISSSIDLRDSREARFVFDTVGTVTCCLPRSPQFPID